jgi:hypothetical protein
MMHITEVYLPIGDILPCRGRPRAALFSNQKDCLPTRP